MALMALRSLLDLRGLSTTLTPQNLLVFLFSQHGEHLVLHPTNNASWSILPSPFPEVPTRVMFEFEFEPTDSRPKKVNLPAKVVLEQPDSIQQGLSPLSFP